MCEAYWLEWLTRLQQYRKKFPEHVVGDTILNQNETGKEVTQAHNLESATNSLGGKTVKSFAVPVAKLGITVKDEDVIEEEELSSKEKTDSLSSQLVEAWKKIWKNICQQIRHRGKTK